MTLCSTCAAKGVTCYEQIPACTGYVSKDCLGKDNYGEEVKRLLAIDNIEDLPF